MPDYTHDDLFTALDDAVAIAHEWDGDGIAAKLAPFGLRPEPVREVIEERLEAHDFGNEDERLAYTQGFAEGLITGAKLKEDRA